MRIDDGFMGNKKIAPLSDSEFRVWMRLLCYCSRAQDPTVDAVVRREVAGLTVARVRRFASEEIGLLDLLGEDTYEVHDWPDYQPKDATNADRQARWRARQKASKQPLLRNEETVTSPVTSLVRASASVQSSPVTAFTQSVVRPVGDDLEHAIARLVTALNDKDEGTEGVIRSLVRKRRLSVGDLIAAKDTAEGPNIRSMSKAAVKELQKRGNPRAA